MALTNIPEVSTAAVTPDRQISLQGGASTAVITYTVPTGRIFRGFAASSTTTSFLLSGAGSNLTAATTAGGFPLTLLAGTSISFNNTSGVLFGIESDA